MNINWVLEEMQSALEKGILVQVDGRYYNGYNSGRFPVLEEEETYMEDYLEDDKGKIIEIIFDRVKIINE
ncbi:MAG: hypothetical protein RR056_02555 [Acetivibrio sp.]